MKKILLKNSASFVIPLFFFSYCFAASTKQLSPEEKIEKIHLGDSADKLAGLWQDKPTEDDEIYDLKTVHLLSFKNSDGKPEAFFSIDPVSNQVIGKSLWVYYESSKTNLESTLKGQFKNISTWQTYIPCHTRSDKDKIFVNRDQGLILDIGGRGVGLITWANSAFLEQKINLIIKTCPKLQPAK